MHKTGWSVAAWGLPVLFWSLWASVARISFVWGQTRQDVKTEFRLIVIRAGLNETFTSASCVICNWLPYLSFIIASASHVRIFISQIFISDLYIFTFIFMSSYFETTSCLHTFGSSSSSHTVLILSSSRFHHAIIITTLQLDIFTSSKLHLSPLLGQPSFSFTCTMGIAPIRESCTDFRFPSTDDEHTGPGYMNQRPASQKKPDSPTDWFTDWLTA